MSVDPVCSFRLKPSSSCRYQKKSKGKKGEKNQKNSRQDDGGEWLSDVVPHLLFSCVSKCQRQMFVIKCDKKLVPTLKKKKKSYFALTVK